MFLLAFLVGCAAPRKSDVVSREMQQRLRAMEEILAALQSTNFAGAHQIAQNRLPLQDLPLPEGTASAAGAFHASVDQFVTQLQRQDLQESVKSLAQIMQQCSACHSLTKR